MDLDLTSLNLWLEQFMHDTLPASTRRTKPKIMRLLCDAFGCPEKSAPCFHVAGSKGKGTIATAISSILTEAGYKVGVLVSPHVVHFAERITLNGEPFPEEIYDAAFKELKSGVEKLVKQKPTIKKLITWDELVTLYGMLVFRTAKVDYAVYEAGLGGRLDPTNVVSPRGVAFGPIELEHTKILGSSLSAIAREKSGIIKTKVHIVSASQHSEAYRVLCEAARVKRAPIVFVPKSAGNYEAVDKHVAYLLVRAALPKIGKGIARAGLRNMRPLPARFEKVEALKNYPDLPFVLIDGAHTPESVAAVLGRLQEEGLERANLLFGCSVGKNVEIMSRKIFDSGLFNRVFLARPSDFKDCSLENIKTAFEKAGFKDLSVDENQKGQISAALDSANAEKVPLVVLGSFYLAGEVKKFLA